MLNELKELLKYLEENINVDDLLTRDRLHKSALSYENLKRLPLIASYPYPDGQRFIPYPHGEVFDDPEKMLYNQFLSTFDQSPFLSLEVGDDLPFSIRADFGCVLLASVFGANIERQGDNPPWVRHRNGPVSYGQIKNTNIDDHSLGMIPKAAQRYEFYRDVLNDYPRLESVTSVTLPDLQGPFDNLELLRGSEVFLDMSLRREEVKESLRILAGAQIKLAKYFSHYVKEKIPGYSHQHGFLVAGEVLIRSDTSIMVSPDMYREIIAPFDEKILRHLSGGIHSCGNVDNIVKEYLNLKSIRCFDYGQSEMNDVGVLYNIAKQKKAGLTRIAVSEEELISGSALDKMPTGVSLIFRASSFEHAQSVIKDYMKGMNHG
jgi:hypothetical protein